MKCKVISAHRSKLEDDINLWLNNKYEIEYVTQTSESDYITITIFYLDKQEIRKNKINKLNKQ